MGKGNIIVKDLHVYLRPKVTLHCLCVYLFRVYVSDIRKVFNSYLSPIMEMIRISVHACFQILLNLYCILCCCFHAIDIS